MFVNNSLICMCFPNDLQWTLYVNRALFTEVLRLIPNRVILRPFALLNLPYLFAYSLRFCWLEYSLKINDQFSKVKEFFLFHCTVHGFQKRRYDNCLRGRTRIETQSKTRFFVAWFRPNLKSLPRKQSKETTFFKIVVFTQTSLREIYKSEENAKIQVKIPTVSTSFNLSSALFWNQFDTIAIEIITGWNQGVTCTN